MQNANTFDLNLAHIAVAHAGGPPIVADLLTLRLDKRTFVSTSFIILCRRKLFKADTLRLAGTVKLHKFSHIAYSGPRRHRQPGCMAKLTDQCPMVLTVDPCRAPTDGNQTDP